jgi:hypothetical protein
MGNIGELDVASVQKVGSLAGRSVDVEIKRAAG